MAAVTASDAAPGLPAAVMASAGRLAPAPGVTGLLDIVVTGTPNGDVKVRVDLVDGRPARVAAGSGPDAALTLTVPAPEAGAIMAGKLDPSVAFMRGRLKTAGDNGLLLGVLAATADPGFGPWLAGLAEATAPQ